MSFGILREVTMNGERYVYYNRLATDNYKYNSTIYKHALAAMNNRVEQGSDIEKIGKYFHKLYVQEAKKERDLLTSKYGIKFSQKYSAKDPYAVGKELIEAVNTIYSTKEIFKREIATITQTNTKDAYTFFPTYFNKVWNEGNYGEQLASFVSDNYKVDDESSFKRAIETWCNKNLRDIIRQALEKLFDAKTNIRIQGQGHDNAWRFLKSKINNDLVESFYQTYEFDKLFESLMTNNYKDKAKSQEFMSKNNYTVNVLGGNAMEIIFNFLAQELGKKSTHTGSTGMKADWIINEAKLTINFDQWLENNNFGTREKDIAAINKLLNNVDDGFIVFVNAKNYTLGADFYRRGGFSAGKPISLNTFYNMTFESAKDLVFMAQQLVKGAIGENNHEKVETAFARAIASALWDDFSINNQLRDNSSGSIHLFNLNGVYIPLSFYFRLLSEAFLEGANTKDLVSVNIQSPEAEFNTDPAYNWELERQRWGLEHGAGSMWAYQRDQSLQKTKISYHFLETFRI